MVEGPGGVDVVHNPVAPWLLIPLVALWGLALVFSIIAPLLALAGIVAIASMTRCRRWRFDATRDQVRFDKGLLPWLRRPEPTLVQRPGMVFTFRNTFMGEGERIESARFAEIERAEVDTNTSSNAASGTTFALVLRMKDGATIGFGVGHESWGLVKKQQAAEAINRVLSSSRASAALPPSSDAESYAGSPIAVPTFTRQDE